MVVTAGAWEACRRDRRAGGRHEVSDERWARIQPLLLKPRRSRWPGRLPLDDRACLNGILFVLLTGIRWTDLPQQLGYDSDDLLAAAA